MPDESGQLSEWLRNYQPLEDTHVAAEMIPRVSDNWRGRYSAHTATPGIPKFNWPACPQLKLNQLYWPTGASRWATFFGIVDSERKDAILSATGPQTSGTLVIGDSRLKASDIETAPTGGYLKTKVDNEWMFGLGTEMFLLPPRPISATDDRGDGVPGLWLIPLVDARYHWQFKNTGTLDDLTTWDALYASLADQLGITAAFSHEAVDDDYYTPSDELERLYCSASVMLDTVAANCGHRIVRDISGNVSAQSAATAESKLDSNLNGDAPYDVWDQIAGGDFSEEADGSIRPENVTVVLPVVSAAGNRRQVAINTESAVNTDNATGLTKVFHDAAQYSNDSSDAIGLLAAQIAADYYAWLTKRFDYTFTGVKPWDQTGFDDSIIWSFGLQRPDGTYKADSRVYSLPYNFGIEELHHGFTDSQSETCGYEVRARCNGNVIENCTYYTCRSISHAVVSRDLIGCDTDSSSDETGVDPPIGLVDGMAASAMCEDGVPEILVFTMYDMQGTDLCDCLGDGSISLSHDGIDTWTGSASLCGYTVTAEFEDLGILTVTWSNGCSGSHVTRSRSPIRCTGSILPYSTGDFVFDWESIENQATEDISLFRACCSDLMYSITFRIKGYYP